MHEKGEFGRYVSIFKKVIDSKSIDNVEDFALISGWRSRFRIFNLID
jgi:hypothetical protein